jgi:hypothetical protein
MQIHPTAVDRRQNNATWIQIRSATSFNWLR